MKTGILLINIGTPDSPSIKDVRKYLRQFLSDPSVIDINPIARFLLVNFIIVPFRAPRSAALYKRIWTKEGSPLQVYTDNLAKKLQKELNLTLPTFGAGQANRSLHGERNTYIVEIGMRYQNPDISSAFRKLKNQKVEKIIAIPLFPQYSSSTTGSAITELNRVMKAENFTNVKTIEHFFGDDIFLNAWVDIAKKYLSPSLLERGPGLPVERNFILQAGGEAFDFFLFSYHGLPERHIFKECKNRGGRCNSIVDCETRNQAPPHSEEGNFNPPECTHPVRAGSQAGGIVQGEFPPSWGRGNSYCYRSACFETTRQLVKRLNIPEGKYATAFQSRMSGNWLKPFSDKLLVEKAKEGIKRMLVFSPSFVADCLETISEIGIGYKNLFIKNGGDTLHLAESLNDSDHWAKSLKKMILNCD